MKITIITPSLNNVSTIRDTIDSIQNQSFQKFEHIIVDGKSIDGTLEVINKLKDHRTIILSKKAKGIYHAINKGIEIATGDYIGILNADDTYMNTNVLQKVVNALQQYKTDSIFGNLIYVDRNDNSKVTRIWESGHYSGSKIRTGWTLPHPSFFVKRTVYENFGKYDELFQISGDYEMIVRLLFKNKISSLYLPIFIVRMKNGGISNKTISNRFIANREDRMVWKKHSLVSSILISILKPARKIPQFLNTKLYSQQVLKPVTNKTELNFSKLKSQ